MRGEYSLLCMDSSASIRLRTSLRTAFPDDAREAREMFEVRHPAPPFSRFIRWIVRLAMRIVDWLFLRRSAAVYPVLLISALELAATRRALFEARYSVDEAWIVRFQADRNAAVVFRRSRPGVCPPNRQSRVAERRLACSGTPTRFRRRGTLVQVDAASRAASFEAGQVLRR